MKNIYIARHGQSQANVDKVICSYTDSPLTDLGRRQAKLAGENAKKYFHFDLIVHSPLNRAADTAKIIAAEMSPSPTLLQINEVRERNLGEREGESYADMDSSSVGRIKKEIPGMESVEDLYERAKKVLEDLNKRPEENILIACHNGIGKMLRVAASGGTHEDFYKEPRLENAVIYKI